MTYSISATNEGFMIHSWPAGTDRVAAITCARHFAQYCARIMYPMATNIRVYEYSTSALRSSCIACYEVE